MTPAPIAAEAKPCLIDLSSFPLAALRQTGNEMLDAAIRRITEQAEGEPAEAICAFNSAL